MVKRFSTVLLLSWLAALASVKARGRTTAPASANEHPSLADRATDDAMQHLFDTIADMPVISNNATLSVAALLASSPQAERQLRETVLAKRHVGNARPLSPNMIAVDVSIETDSLNQALHNAINDEPSTAKRQVKLATYSASAILATGQACEDGVDRDRRPGWRHCAKDAIVMARKAAEYDLRQRLLAWLLRVPLANGVTMSQMARQDSRIRIAMRRQLDKIAGSEFVFEPTGVCVLTCTISAEQLNTILRLAMKEVELPFDGNLRPAVAFENTMNVQGFSLAPPRPIVVPDRIIRWSRPNWADQTLTKTASANAPTLMNDTATRKVLAIQAAHIEASRQLWIELEKLAMPNGQSLGEYLASKPNREQLINTVNADINTLSGPRVNDQGIATVTLGLQLENVWRIVGNRPVDK